MTDRTQPEALRLADWLQAAVQTYPQMSEDEPGGYASEVDQIMDEAAAELRRQHTRIAELEAELEAVGAGGVSGPLIGRATDMSKEREDFEAWYCDQMRAAGYNADEGIAYLREGNHYGEHRVMLNGKWEGWQARASLQSTGFDAADMATASAQEAQEPVAYVHVPHYTVEGKVRPVVSFEKYQQDYADGIYSTRIPLYAAPQPAPAPLSDDVSQKTWALIDELEKMRSASRDDEDWITLNARDSELRAALAAQGGKA